MENKCNMVSRMRSWDIKKILSKNEGNLDKVSALANNIYVGSFIVTNMDNKMSILRRVRLVCNPMDCSPPGSSIQGIPQARILEWVAISFSRGSS